MQSPRGWIEIAMDFKGWGLVMIRNIGVGMLPALALAAAAAPATAAVPTTCVGYATTVLTGWTACAGFYNSNVFGGDAAKVAQQKEAVEFLGGTYDGNFNALFGFPELGDNSDGPRTINFGQTFYGKRIIGAHFGNIGEAQDEFGNVSGFWMFDFGTQGASSITFVQSRGLSNLYVFDGAAPVPEPSTWALLIASFGVLGAAMRRRQRVRLAAFA
jgi:hypothetical protein